MFQLELIRIALSAAVQVIVNLIEFLKEVMKAFDESRTVDVVNMDFSKAFANVHLRRLIQKIKMDWDPR